MCRQGCQAENSATRGNKKTHEDGEASKTKDDIRLDPWVRRKLEFGSQHEACQAGAGCDARFGREMTYLAGGRVPSST